MQSITVTPLHEELIGETWATKLFTEPKMGDYMKSEKGKVGEIIRIIHLPDGFVELLIDKPLPTMASGKF